VVKVAQLLPSSLRCGTVDGRVGKDMVLASEVCRGTHELEWGLPTLLLVLYSSVQYYKYCHPNKIGAVAATTMVDPAWTHV